METSTLLNDVNQISEPMGGSGDNDNEKNSGKLDRDKVPPCADPAVHVSISNAEKRLKKLERDYRHTYENYTKTLSNLKRYYAEVRHSKFCSRREANCIAYYENMRDGLQNDLDELNKAEATQKGTEKHDHRKKFSMLHGCKSLAQEKTILQQIEERQYPETTNPSQETIKRTDFSWKMGTWQFYGVQSKISKRSSKKQIHKPLRRVKETDNVREMAIANDKPVGNPTSEDSMAKIEIKLLTKVIKKLEKERRETTRMDPCWDVDRWGVCPCMSWNEEEKKYVAGYREKMTRLAKQCKSMREKCEEEIKYIEGLKKIHDGCAVKFLSKAYQLSLPSSFMTLLFPM